MYDCVNIFYLFLKYNHHIFLIAMSSLPTTSRGHGEDVLTPPSSPAHTTVTIPSATSSTDGTSRLLIRVEENK